MRSSSQKWDIKIFNKQTMSDGQPTPPGLKLCCSVPQFRLQIAKLGAFLAPHIFKTYHNFLSFPIGFLHKFLYWCWWQTVSLLLDMFRARTNKHSIFRHALSGVFVAIMNMMTITITLQQYWSWYKWCLVSKSPVESWANPSPQV